MAWRTPAAYERRDGGRHLDSLRPIGAPLRVRRGPRRIIACHTRAHPGATAGSGPATAAGLGGAMRTDRLDRIDQAIVSCLLDNARASYAEIGARVNLSAPAVK